MASQDRRCFSNGATRGNCCMGLLVAISFAFKSDGASDYSEEVAAGLNVDVGWMFHPCGAIIKWQHCCPNHQYNSAFTSDRKGSIGCYLLTLYSPTTTLPWHVHRVFRWHFSHSRQSKACGLPVSLTFGWSVAGTDGLGHACVCWIGSAPCDQVSTIGYSSMARLLNRKDVQPHQWTPPSLTPDLAPPFPWKVDSELRVGQQTARKCRSCLRRCAHLCPSLAKWKFGWRPGISSSPLSFGLSWRWRPDWLQRSSLSHFQLAAKSSWTCLLDHLCTSDRKCLYLALVCAVMELCLPEDGKATAQSLGHTDR